MTEDEKAQMFLDEVQEQAGLPKIKLSHTGSCYSYAKLKKEGLLDQKEVTCFVDESQVDCETWGDTEVYDDYTDPYGGH